MEETTVAAVEASEQVVNALTSGCQSVVDFALNGLTSVIPIGLGLLAITLGTRIVMNFFRSLAR